MFSVPTSPAALKPRSVLPPPQFCPRCKGAGWLGYTDGGDSVECPDCHGWGYGTEAVPALPVCYVCASGCDEVDVGLHLQSFVEQLIADWPSLESDLVLWQLTAGEPCRWRAVAVLFPGVSGTECRYL